MLADEDWGTENVPTAVKRVSFYTVLRRQIRLIESNAKSRYLRQLTCKGTLRQVFYLSEVLSPPMTPYYPPLHTVYVYTVYLFIQGKGEEGGGELTREKVRGAIVHKAGQKLYKYY